jgi:hypothetical protein
MNGTKNDIDPATELVEEDDEQALPEQEPAIDLAAGAGPLAVGRAVIARHAKLAPSSPGVYRMIDGKGDVLYVGKAKNIRKRIIAYTRPTGYDPRFERMIAATAARSQSDQTAAAALQRAAARRQVVSLYSHHRRPLGAADSQAPRRAQPRRQLLRPVRLGLGGQPHHHCPSARVPVALLLRWIFREP